MTVNIVPTIDKNYKMTGWSWYTEEDLPTRHSLERFETVRETIENALDEVDCNTMVIRRMHESDLPAKGSTATFNVQIIVDEDNAVRGWSWYCNDGRLSCLTYPTAIQVCDVINKLDNVDEVVCWWMKDPEEVG